VIDPPTTTPEIFISLTQVISATVVPTAAQTAEVTVDPLTITLPPALASGMRGIQVAPANGQDLPYWSLTPGHTQINLEGYFLHGKSLQPQIFIYPAQAYAELVPSAFESMHRLNNVLGSPGAAITSEQLPAVPFFNAQQVFASNIQIVTFQSGRGVRFLTEYAQYPASANNVDLFYNFQGFTSDGAYYIAAILPITAPLLGDSSDPAAALPVGGIAYPNTGDPNADFKGYYHAVTVQLNAASPESFAPTLNQLDLMIQSMRITQ
jgi:hypothetical protein